MLIELTNINGVSGDKKRVREYILNKIKPLCHECFVDTMGNIIALKKGKGETNHKIMVCAHMDEVGFIVTGFTDKGYLKFECVGGIDTRVIISGKIGVVFIEYLHYLLTLHISVILIQIYTTYGTTISRAFAPQNAG